MYTPFDTNSICRPTRVNEWDDTRIRRGVFSCTYFIYNISDVGLSRRVFCRCEGDINDCLKRSVMFRVHVCMSVSVFLYSILTDFDLCGIVRVA